MGNVKFRVFENAEKLYDSLAHSYNEMISKYPNITLGLATGATPIPLYQRLVKYHKQNGTSYSNVITYNLDEYANLSTSHPESYYAFMHRHFFDLVNINPNNIHLPIGDTSDLEKSAGEYNDLLKDANIDIQLLGVGANGHIGFNEPFTSFDSEVHVVTLTDKTREDNSRFFASIDDVPTKAITMGIKNIMAASKIILVAIGKNKCKAIKMLKKGIVNEEFPVTALLNHDDVEVYADMDAHKEDEKVEKNIGDSSRKVKTLLMCFGNTGTTLQVAKELESQLDGEVTIYDVTQKEKIEFGGYDNYVFGTNIRMGNVNKKFRKFAKKLVNYYEGKRVFAYFCCANETYNDIYALTVADYLPEKTEVVHVGGLISPEHAKGLSKRILISILASFENSGRLAPSLNDEAIKKLALSINA